MKKIFFTLIALIFFLNTFSQSTSGNIKRAPYPVTQSPTPDKTTVSFMGGIIYAPKLHYYGRTDDLNSNAIIPTLLIKLDSVGVYVSGSGVFINNAQQTMEYAGTIIEGGYRFGKRNKGFAGNVYANKFFYDTRQLPQSAIKAQGGLNLTYQTKYVNINSSGSLAFSNNTDVFTSLGVEHAFRYKKDKSIFVAVPTFLANAGSQNFITEDSQDRRFTLLDLEASVPLIWARKNIYLIITPTYVIPKNVITVLGHPDLSEKASNLFFANITVLFSFKK